MPKINNLQAFADKLRADPGALAQLIGLLQPAPAAGSPASVAAPKREKKRPVARISYWTDDELQALRRAVAETGSARDVAILELAVSHGLRASEIGLLTMDRLRMRDKRLYVERVKRGNSGEHMLFEPDVRALRAWLRVRGEAPGPLFPSTWKRPISPQRLDRLVKQWGAAAGIPREKRHMHCARHTCATRLLERGADIRAVQDWLGHRDIGSTTIYAQVTDKGRREMFRHVETRW